MLRDGMEDSCGKPGVDFQPCLCDECDARCSNGLPPIHEAMWFCAEHYDELMAREELLKAHGFTLTSLDEL
jgi:hypothetical protein